VTQASGLLGPLAYSIRSAMGVPSSTVRDTIHSRSCDFRTASGSNSLAFAQAPIAVSSRSTAVKSVPAPYLS